MAYAITTGRKNFITQAYMHKGSNQGRWVNKVHSFSNRIHNEYFQSRLFDTFKTRKIWKITSFIFFQIRRNVHQRGEKKTSLYFDLGQRRHRKDVNDIGRHKVWGGGVLSHPLPRVSSSHSKHFLPSPGLALPFRLRANGLNSGCRPTRDGSVWVCWAARCRSLDKCPHLRVSSSLFC